MKFLSVHCKFDWKGGIGRQEWHETGEMGLEGRDEIGREK